MGKKIPLGSERKEARAVITTPATLEERVDLLQHTVSELVKTVKDFIEDGPSRRRIGAQLEEINNDELPIGLCLIGISTRGGTSALTVRNDGYYVGQNRYDSLSAAAEAVSGVRRSGWTFWRMSDGRTIKETFGKR